MANEKRTRPHKWEATFDALSDVRRAIDGGKRDEAIKSAERAAAEARKFTSSARVREETSMGLALLDVIENDIGRPLRDSSEVTFETFASRVVLSVRAAQRIVKREAATRAVSRVQSKSRRESKRSAGEIAIRHAIAGVVDALKVRR